MDKPVGVTDPLTTNPTIGRNLVICCDGTNNQFGPENTNVVRLVQALDRDSAKQRIYYDPGVGTLPNPGTITAFGRRLSEYWDLAFAGDLLFRVERAYQYIMDYWEPGDRVFLFGFSRGAYTVRVLAGLLHVLGLMPRGGSNLLPYVTRLFKSIRSERSANYWKLCDEFRRTFARPILEGSNERHFRVHFLGVWDTVSSVGWVWDPARFPYTAYNPSIRTVRHAVSIDERRAFFRQNLMKPAKNQDLVEVWFPGVHCDVGGGYPRKESRLWQIPFQWMLEQATQAKVGLITDPDRLQRVLGQAPSSSLLWADPVHNSLTPAWLLAEAFPKVSYSRKFHRRLPRFNLGRHRFIQDGALIHRSALERIRDKSLRYELTNLTQGFCTAARELVEVPEQLPFWRETTMENFGAFLFSEAVEAVSPLRIASSYEQDFRNALNIAAQQVQALPGAYEKFSEAANNELILVSEMRDFARRSGITDLQENTWQHAVEKLRPLWPFC